jgi:hypothetical protein
MLIKVGDTSVDIRVHAVLSMPRLSFTSNHFGWWKALMPLGIEPTMGTGAFWSQVNTRIFEQVLDDYEYILTLDYDSFVLKEDIEHLFALAMTFGCDALAPIQTKREDGRPMFTMLGTLDDPPADGTTTCPASGLLSLCSRWTRHTSAARSFPREPSSDASSRGSGRRRIPRAAGGMAESMTTSTSGSSGRRAATVALSALA